MAREADRMKNVPLSGIRNILNLANQLSSEGRRVIHLELGMPDFDTPQHIKDGTIRALEEGKVFYPPINGIPELRQAIATKLKTENALDYDPDEILVGVGVAQGMMSAILSYLNPGDEILIPDPGFLNYIYLPHLAGGVIRNYHLLEVNGYHPDMAEIEGLITSRTRMITLISPNNPTGTLLTQTDLNAIADISTRYDLLVLADEIYERLTYDTEAISIASLPGMKERTILLNGFSKYYSMTGWRLGYIAADRTLIDPMLRFNFYNTTSATSFIQWGALEALQQNNSISEQMKAEFKRRRDYLHQELNTISGLSCHQPDGAFYIWLNIQQTGMSSEEFATELLKTKGVATVPGPVFGVSGEGYIRVSYATAFSELVDAVSEIKAFLAEKG